jgi:hypothetical protein
MTFHYHLSGRTKMGTRRRTKETRWIEVEEAVMEVTESPYITVEQQQAFDREMNQSLVHQDGKKGQKGGLA